MSEWLQECRSCCRALLLEIQRTFISEAASLRDESEQPPYGGCRMEAANWLTLRLALILISVDDRQGEALVTRHRRELCGEGQCSRQKAGPSSSGVHSQALGGSRRLFPKLCWPGAWPQLLGLLVSPVVSQAEARLIALLLQ